jgi:hypothetical protein
MAKQTSLQTFETSPPDPLSVNREGELAEAFASHKPGVRSLAAGNKSENEKILTSMPKRCN